MNAIDALRIVMSALAVLVLSGATYSARVNLDNGRFRDAIGDMLIACAFVLAMLLVDDLMAAALVP